MRPIRNHFLNVETYGPEDGPAVVLLHHGLGSVRAWKEQIPALAGAGFWVAVYDRWGYGRSQPRPRLSQPDFPEDIKDLHELMDSLGIQRASLIGHSDGGTIALAYTTQHPERVERLVVVAAHVYVEPKMDAGIQGVKAAFEQDKRFREGLRRVHGDQVEQVFSNWYEGWRRPESLEWDMRPQLKTIACPVLVVQGMEDEHATPQHARDLAAAIPHAELWLVKGAGHMLPQEHPDMFNERVCRFLSQEVP